MIRRLILAAAFLPSMTAAHPHLDVEQQLHITLGAQAVELSWLIVPPEDGGHIFNHLDANADGTVDAAERASFSRDVLASTVVSIDGRPMNLEFTGLNLPERDAMLAGTAAIEVNAKAEGPVASATSVTARVDYSTFSENWFIQPFYETNLKRRSAPRILREEGAVILTLPDPPVLDTHGF